jgi:hypothetical protein
MALMRRLTSLPSLPAVAMLCTASLTAAADLHGIATLGGAAAHARSDDFTAGMDKSPFGLEAPAGRITMRAESTPVANIVATVVADADSGRSSVFDVQEAWLGWNPVPTSPWRVRARAGAFFPVSSVEVGYQQVGWNAQRTISSAVINSWIAEEVRILGVELAGQWRGALLGSPHTFTARLGIFGGNDPAGTEIAWRGWNVGGRITGLFQQLRLPDLPVYRPDGDVPLQTRDVHEFREIDHRPGWYEALGYSFEGRLDIEAMHYDNRADPLRVKDGQYSWRTRFDHASARLQWPGDWELLAQAITGSTLMGPHAVHVRFKSWYLLANHRLGPGLATMRYDWFRTTEHDLLPADPNHERGHAWALDYSLPLPHSLTLLAEVQRVRSRREARALIGETPDRREDAIALELRWEF